MTSLLLAAIPLGAVVCWLIRHPCLEERAVVSTCGGGMLCMAFDADGMCTMWVPQPTYPCIVTECVKRKP